MRPPPPRRLSLNLFPSVPPLTQLRSMQLPTRAYCTLCKDAYVVTKDSEQARRRRTWENQLVLNSIAALATRINGSFRGYCSRVVVFPLVRATLFDGRTAVWHTLERTNTPEGAA